jgi:hypothetical protein
LPWILFFGGVKLPDKRIFFVDGATFGNVQFDLPAMLPGYMSAGALKF